MALLIPVGGCVMNRIGALLRLNTAAFERQGA
jgi:hypothetical protein